MNWPSAAARRLAIVAFHAYPDPAVGAKRVSELANHLAAAGWQVVIVAQTPSQSDPSRNLHDEVRRIAIRRQRPIALRLRDALYRLFGRSTQAAAKSGATIADSEPSRRTPSLLDRIETHYHQCVGAIDDHKLWTATATRMALADPAVRAADVVMVSGPPWSTLLGATYLARQLRKPLVIDFRDPWFPRAAGYAELPGYLREVDVAAERWCVSHAAALVTSSHALAARLRLRYPRFAGPIELVRNGFDDDFRIDSPVPLGRLEMLYAGTIYYNRNPLPLLDGIAQLVARQGIDRSKIRLRLVGYADSWQGRPLRPLATARGIDDIVEFVPPVSGAEVRALTAASNLIVNFSQGQPEQVPAKLYEQLVSARYGLLFAEAESEAARVAACAPFIQRLDDDPNACAEALARIYEIVVDGRPGPRPSIDAAVLQHSRGHSNTRFAELLGRAASAVPAL